MTETAEQRRERLSARMDKEGGEWACAFLGLHPTHADWFASQPRAYALRHLDQLHQLPAHDRERDLMERNGADGRVKQ